MAGQSRLAAFETTGEPRKKEALRDDPEKWGTQPGQFLGAGMDDVYKVPLCLEYLPGMDTQMQVPSLTWQTPTKYGVPSNVAEATAPFDRCAMISSEAQRSGMPLRLDFHARRQRNRNPSRFLHTSASKIKSRPDDGDALRGLDGVWRASASSPLSPLAPVSFRKPGAQACI